MPNRIIKESICTSPNIDALTRQAECFFYRLMVQCDDYGRMDGRTAILRAKCYPLQIDTVTTNDVAAWLSELVAAQLVIVYSVDGAPYLQMKTWERHQQIRAKKSKYPQPISSDINCNQMQANVPVIQSNPIQSEVESNPNVVVVVGDATTESIAAVFAAWQDNIPGTMTPIISDELADLVTTYGATNVIRAITEAVRANIRTMRYVAGILRNQQNGTEKPASNGRVNGHGRNGKVTNVDISNTSVDNYFAKKEALQ